VGSDLVSRILTGNEFQTLGAENRKARDANVNLWRGLRADENWISAETALRFMMLQEVRKIWRTISVQSFEGHGGKFKPYAPFNRKPVELFEKFI